MIVNFRKRTVESVEIDGEEGIKFEWKFDERFGRLMIKLSHEREILHALAVG